MITIVLLLAGLLSGCATERIVQVPVSVPCLGPAVSEPDYQYGVGSYPGEVQAAKALAVDLIAAKQYSEELKARMSGCN